jgi:murein L,D-transpeptidase YcbB/YkuD
MKEISERTALIPMVRQCLSMSLLLVLCLLGACGGPEADDESNGGDATPEAPPIRADTPLGKAVLDLRRSTEGGSWRGDLEQVLSGWKGPRQPMTDLLRATYRGRGYRPVFLDALWPSPAAAIMVKAVREVPSHGLPHSPYRPKVVVPLYEALALDPEAGAGTLTEPIGDLERLAKLEWQLPRSIYKRPRKNELVPEVRYRPLEKLPELPAVEPEVRCLLELLRDAAVGELREPESAISSRCQIAEASLDQRLMAAREVLAGREAHRASLALLDALLLQAYYTWILDFTIDARVHPFKSLGTVNRVRLPTDSQEALLAALPDFGDAEAVARTLRGAVPEVPQYDLARRALDRYVRLMDSTDTSELRNRGQFEKGATGDAVEAIQRRLAAEAFYEGPINGQFDEATFEGVVRYQRTHGLADGGVVGAQTIESMNIPLEWRVKQLLVSLGSWRESPIVRGGTPDFYVRVNLPAFELRVIRHGEAIRRHKVIVGSNRREEDPLNDRKMWHLHRTQIFDTKINEVVINPTWIVPEAIRIDEIMPKAGENASYLAENNFKKVGDLLVQGPGATNPLGVLKFSLESTDAIYLHDTDKRWLFSETDRALSHGCIRVDQPVELAKFVLGLQGVAPERIDRRIEEGVTLPIKLEAPIPIFIEYNTVGFTDEGEPVFFPDIYHYDVAFWKKRTPITRRFP